MSYANSGSGRERIVAIGLVGLIQGGIIAALVSGLAIHFVPKAADPPITTYLLPEEVPPPPEMKQPDPAEPMKTVATPMPKPIAPTPIVPTTSKPFMVTSMEITPPPPVDYQPIPIPSTAPPPPPPADLSRRAAARGSVADWFPRSEYPSAALRANSEGRVSVLLSVSSTGKATDCQVVAGSGDASLDAATCKLALRNGRFEPARDSAGNKTATQLKLPPILWRIEN